MSEQHQKIILVVVLQVIATLIKTTSDLNPFNMDVDRQLTTDSLIERATTTTSTPLITDEHDDGMNCVKETINILTTGIETLQEELQQIGDQALQQSQMVEKTEQNMVTVKSSIEESDATLQAQKTNLDILNQSLQTLKQEVEESQYTSYDGTLVWKISNVQEKMGNGFLNLNFENR